MNINATLIGQTIMFAMFVWFCMKFIWPPLIAAMEVRKKRIADGLLAAERGFLEQKRSVEKAKKTLDQSKEQATKIIANANNQAIVIVGDAKSVAIEEADKIKVQANTAIEQDIIHARNELKQQISGLVMHGVHVVLAKEVDSKAHKDILDKLSQTL